MDISLKKIKEFLELSLNILGVDVERKCKLLEIRDISVSVTTGS